MAVAKPQKKKTPGSHWSSAKFDHYWSKAQINKKLREINARRKKNGDRLLDITKNNTRSRNDLSFVLHNLDSDYVRSIRRGYTVKGRKKKNPAHAGVTEPMNLIALAAGAFIANKYIK